MAFLNQSKSTLEFTNDEIIHNEERVMLDDIHYPTVKVFNHLQVETQQNLDFQYVFNLNSTNLKRRDMSNKNSTKYQVEKLKINHQDLKTLKQNLYQQKKDLEDEIEEETNDIINEEHNDLVLQEGIKQRRINEDIKINQKMQRLQAIKIEKNANIIDELDKKIHNLKNILGLDNGNSGTIRNIHDIGFYNKKIVKFINLE